MDAWHATYLGQRQLPAELTAFELEAFFSFSEIERRAIALRREPLMILSLALQVGFLRMSGCLLDSVTAVPPALWKHLGEQFDVAAPDVASLPAMYSRYRTLFDHQKAARAVLGYSWMGYKGSVALARELRKEAERTVDRDRLLAFARQRLYEQRLLTARQRHLPSMVARAIGLYERSLAVYIRKSVGKRLLADWEALVVKRHASGSSVQHWLWAAPAKQSIKQIEGMKARYTVLRDMSVDRHLGTISDVVLRRQARLMASRPPAIAARIEEPRRTVRVACFLRYCLLVITDQLLHMVRRRVADLWRTAQAAVEPNGNQWHGLYRELADEIISVFSDPASTFDNARSRLTDLVDAQDKRRPPSRAELVRRRMIEGNRPVRELLKVIVDLPWRATADHPVALALVALNGLYNEEVYTLPDGLTARLGKVWRSAIEGPDRKRAFQAFEVATLLGLRRALRSGTVWIEHSLSFRARERLFFPAERWSADKHLYYKRLGLPRDPAEFLEPLVERAKAGMNAVAEAATKGTLRVDDELHLAPLTAQEKDPKLALFRESIDFEIGTAQLPQIILVVDSQVRFSWLMLGREPRSNKELLMVYAGILAYGTSMSAAETARMIPQLTPETVRQAMRWASDEGRIAEASSAVLDFMRRHPITSIWGRSDLASSDMMSLETTRKVFQAYLDPRRRTPAVGMYSHTRAFWGISCARPILLKERQAGAAIEGAIRDDRLETSQLAVDTHGYTHFGMGFSGCLSLALCPRLKSLNERHLFLPIGTAIPESIQSICRADVDLKKIEGNWDEFVHLVASVHAGNASAITVLNRFGSASTGDPLYEAGVHLGRLMLTVFLADYFLDDGFRREILELLNRGESVNALKRAIHVGRVSSHRAKRSEELQATTGALALLANIVMAWNTAKMQVTFDDWRMSRGYEAPPELIARVAPTRLEGINLRGTLQFPIEAFIDRLLPSSRARTGTDER